MHIPASTIDVLLLERGLTPETLCPVMLRVGDLDRSIDFCKKVRSNQCCKKSAEAVKLCGGKIVREPGPITVINTKITACLDPEGWRSV